MCGVDLAARQVRWRLRPPPPSRPDARTPGSCRGKRGVFLGFQAISAVTGGAPEKRGTTEARWQPVCRRSSREPGFVVRGRRSRDTSPRKADGGSNRRPAECCRPGESASGMDPSYIPRMSRIKFVIGACGRPSWPVLEWIERYLQIETVRELDSQLTRPLVAKHREEIVPERYVYSGAPNGSARSTSSKNCGRPAMPRSLQIRSEPLGRWALTRFPT